MSGNVVSVLIPSYRDHQLVERSLPRILSSGDDLEVVVLNNDTAQLAQLRDIVRAIGDSRVRIVELEHKAGFTRAINAGIETTGGEFVFFANSDLFVSDSYVDEILRFFAGHPRAGAVTGKILRFDLDTDQETDVIDTTGHIIARNRRVADRGENQRDLGQYEHEEEVFSVSGAALVARREALEAVKVLGEYLDESFDMYKDDIDLCWRLRLAGWECWYVPSAVAYHARTTKGLGRKSYLSATRQFHDNEQTKSIQVRMNSMRNLWLLLVKNDDAKNVVRDLPRILGRQALIIGYNLVTAPRETIVTLWQFTTALPRARTQRREMKAKQSVLSSEIRRWFLPGSHPS